MGSLRHLSSSENLKYARLWGSGKFDGQQVDREYVLKDEDIQKINRKVRIGVGDRDYMVSIEETVNVYRLLQHGELQIFPNTQHPLERVSVSDLAYSISNFFR